MHTVASNGSAPSHMHAILPPILMPQDVESLQNLCSTIIYIWTSVGLVPHWLFCSSLKTCLVLAGCTFDASPTWDLLPQLYRHSRGGCQIIPWECTMRRYHWTLDLCVYRFLRNHNVSDGLVDISQMPTLPVSADIQWSAAGMWLCKNLRSPADLGRRYALT